jgi:hypothetical protein
VKNVCFIEERGRMFEKKYCDSVPRKDNKYGIGKSIDISTDGAFEKVFILSTFDITKAIISINVSYFYHDTRFRNHCLNVFKQLKNIQ